MQNRAMLLDPDPSIAGAADPADLPAGVSAQELFHGVPDGLVVVDPDGVVLAVNDSLLTLLGHTRAALVGKPVEVLVPPAARERHVAARTGSGVGRHARGMGAGLELHALAADGSLIAVDVMLGPLPSAGEGCVLAAVRDVRQRSDREADWRHRAMHDPLTGLANRSLVEDRLSRACRRAERHDSAVAVVFLDVDGFKRVNDELGHAAGDRLLVVVAERLGAATRPGDVVGRVGGDEFVVVLDGVGDPALHVDRLRSVLCAPAEVGGRLLPMSVSLGVATTGEGLSAEELLATADRRMYRDKATRRQVR